MSTNASNPVSNQDPNPTIYQAKNHEDSHEVLRLLGEHGIQGVAFTSFEGVDLTKPEQDFSNLPVSVSVKAPEAETAKQILRNHGREC